MAKNSRIEPGNKAEQHKEGSDEEGRGLFLQAMEDVVPLNTIQRSCGTGQRKEPFPASTLKFRRRQASSEQAVPKQALMPLSCHDVESIAPEADIHFCHPSVSPAVFKSLRKGLLPVEYNVDFHGCTIEEASKTLVQFINYCHDNQFRCVRIIHGKSYKNYSRTGLTLKSFVARWLTQLPKVLACASCIPRDGGQGAVYVLLKRKR